MYCVTLQKRYFVLSVNITNLNSQEAVSVQCLCDSIVRAVQPNIPRRTILYVRVAFINFRDCRLPNVLVPHFFITHSCYFTTLGLCMNQPCSVVKSHSNRPVTAMVV